MYSIVVLSVLLGTVTCLVGWRPCPTPPPALPAGEAGAELCTSAIPLLLGRSVCLKPRAEREVGVAETPRSWRRGDVPLRPELAGGTRHSGAAVEQVGQTGINTARAGVLMPRFGPVTAIFTEWCQCPPLQRDQSRSTTETWWLARGLTQKRGDAPPPPLPRSSVCGQGTTSGTARTTAAVCRGGTRTKKEAPRQGTGLRDGRTALGVGGEEAASCR